MNSLGCAGIGGSDAYAGTASKWNFAWALHAGLAYQIWRKATIELSYRYVDLGNARSGGLVRFDGTNNFYNPMEFNHLTSHDVRLGMSSCWRLIWPPPPRCVAKASDKRAPPVGGARKAYVIDVEPDGTFVMSRLSLFDCSGPHSAKRIHARSFSIGLAMCAAMAIWPGERAAAADWPLRGSLAPQTTYARWDGWQFGVLAGYGNMNTDFGNSTSSLVGFILRNSTLEAEGAPSTWTALPSNP